MELNELYELLEWRYAYVPDTADAEVLALIKLAKGMQKGLATYERNAQVKDKAMKTLTDAHRRLKFDYTWLNNVNRKLFNQHYALSARDVPFTRYMTDYLFAHGFLKNGGTVRTIPEERI